MEHTFRWSFSQWENYDGCPQRWRFKSVEKLPSLPPGPAAARGLDMHDRAERYIKGEINLDYAVRGDINKRFGDKKAAVIAQKYIPILDAYRDHPNGDRHTEKKIAFDSEWFCCGKSTRSGRGGVVMVLDAVRYGGDWQTVNRLRKDPHPDRTFQSSNRKIVRIAEWKSGTPKESHREQRHLYSIAGLKLWLAEECEVTTYYLEDTDKPVKLRVTADDLPRLIKKWDDRVDRWRNDKILAPKPGAHCNWCDYAKKKGGPCQFGS